MVIERTSLARQGRSLQAPDIVQGTSLWGRKQIPVKTKRGKQNQVSEHVFQNVCRLPEADYWNKQVAEIQKLV